MVTSSQPSQSIAQRQIQAFEQRYGTAALDLACHAAFPLALTTDLVYCLRENFVTACPWYGAADVLLSGLWHPVGYDLYEIAGELRQHLLQRLRSRFGEPRLYELEAFMTAYISYRLGIENTDRPLRLGDHPHWTALACLNPGAAYEAIQRELQHLASTEDLKERLRLAALVESYADWLPSSFRPILLDWADQTAEGELIDETPSVVAALTQAGLVLELKEFEVVTFTFAEDEATVSDELQPFEFETVTVNARDKITRREQRQAFYFAELLAPDVALEMVAIPSGQFQMGSPPNETGRYDDEGPQYEVTVEPFFISRYPVTQAQWRAVAAYPQVERSLEADPSRFKGGDRPVERISWNDAVEFCQRLSIKTGCEYRLPTEAEWEYACRAGTTTPFHFGETITTKVANYAGDAYGNGPERKLRGETTRVGSFPANAYGLHDMHGNVREWCLDHWHENYQGVSSDGSAWISSDKRELGRVIRGGSWNADARFCRSAYRSWDYPNFTILNLGFRVVCVAPRTQ